MEDTGSLYLRPTWLGPSQLIRDYLPPKANSPTPPPHDAEPAEPTPSCDSRAEAA